MAWLGHSRRCVANHRVVGQVRAQRGEAWRRPRPTGLRPAIEHGPVGRSPGDRRGQHVERAVFPGDRVPAARRREPGIAVPGRDYCS